MLVSFDRIKALGVKLCFTPSFLFLCKIPNPESILIHILVQFKSKNDVIYYHIFFLVFPLD